MSPGLDTKIDISELLTKRRDQVIIVAMVVLSLLVGRGVYQGQMAKYAQLKDKISAEQEKKDALDRIIILDEKIKINKKRSWNTFDSNAIIEYIFSAGRESQIKITNISPGTKQEEKNYIAILFSLTAEGTYKSLLNFIKRLETFPMLWRIKTVQFVPMSRNPGASETAPSSGIPLTASLTMEAIYMR